MNRRWIVWRYEMRPAEGWVAYEVFAPSQLAAGQIVLARYGWRIVDIEEG